MEAGQVIQEEYRDIVQVCRDGHRRAKAHHLELIIARNVKGNKKIFYMFISRKRKTWGNVGLLLIGEGDLVTRDTEKAEVLNTFFTAVFTVKTSLQELQDSHMRKIWTTADFALEGEDWVREHINKLVFGALQDVLTSAEGPGRCHCEATFNYLLNVLAIGRNFQGLEESKCHFCLQEGQERVSGEQQAGQVHLNPWKGDGATNP